ncbi:MAG: serpin family protein [Rhodocyclaceae bacterium]|nr:serpin family protein [Rhodocyclaceae bacterium]
MSPETPNPEHAGAPDDAVARLARGGNAFAFDLYRQLRALGGNLVLSPASVSTALAMTWAGARGATASQMKTALHLDGSVDGVLAASGRLTSMLEDARRPIRFRIANRLFGEKTFDFESAYLTRIRAAFGAPMELLDFRLGPELARRHINGWVADKTEDRIRDLLPGSAITDDTRLVLVNAIDFLGDWETPFETVRTRPAAFRKTAGESVEVPTMNRTGTIRHVSRDGLSAIELPYRGGDMSMVLVVPEAVDGLAALEASLNADTLDALIADLTPRHVWMAVPKFEIAPTASLSLGAPLVALGMGDAFDRSKADFTAMADPPSPADRLAIDEVYHKAFVKVDEKGTEAAAATAVVMQRAATAVVQHIAFKADRPFLFFIRDRKSGLILFMGRVVDPSVT